MLFTYGSVCSLAPVQNKSVVLPDIAKWCTRAWACVHESPDRATYGLLPGPISATRYHIQCTEDAFSFRKKPTISYEKVDIQISK